MKERDARTCRPGPRHAGPWTLSRSAGRALASAALATTAPEHRCGAVCHRTLWRNRPARRGRRAARGPRSTFPRSHGPPSACAGHGRLTSVRAVTSQCVRQVAFPQPLTIGGGGGEGCRGGSREPVRALGACSAGLIQTRHSGRLRPRQSPEGKILGLQGVTGCSVQ